MAEVEESNPFLPLVANGSNCVESETNGREQVTAAATANTEPQEQPSRRRTPRGVLSFIKPEALRQYAYDESLMHTHALKSRRMSKRQRRRATHSGSPVIQGHTLSGSHGDTNVPSPYDPPMVLSSNSSDGDEAGKEKNNGNGPSPLMAQNDHCDLESHGTEKEGLVPFDASQTEFTLFFFGAPYCFHSLQFIPRLANFVHEQNARYAGDAHCDSALQQKESDAPELPAVVESTTKKRPVQCVCIPDAMHQPAIQNFCYGTGMYYFDDPSDIGLSSARAFFQVSYIPAVIVLNNATGKVVTDCGRTAIEFSPDKAVEAWRVGYSGASMFWKFCTMS
jgi:hypothetical protein